jgi:hypothetical protein
LPQDFRATVDLYLYPTQQSGRSAAVHGFFRPNGFSRRHPILGRNGDLAYGLIFEIGEAPMAPGETRRMTCSFIYQESFDAFMDAEKFYVWDGRIVGEVTLIAPEK